MDTFNIFIYSYATKSIINFDQKCDQNLSYEEAMRRANLYISRNPKTEIIVTDAYEIYHFTMHNDEVDIDCLYGDEADALFMMWGLMHNPYSEEEGEEEVEDSKSNSDFRIPKERMEGRWESCHIEDSEDSESETENENPFIIVICSGGEDTGYLIQQEIFSESRKAEAMSYYINQDSIGAEPEIKIFYKYDEDGENPYFKYFEDADLVK